MRLENDLEQNLKDLEQINLNSKVALLNVLESQRTSLEKKIDNLEDKRLKIKKNHLGYSHREKQTHQRSPKKSNGE